MKRVDAHLVSPNETKKRKRIVALTHQDKLELARKAQIESQIKAKERAQKRKAATEIRELKRKREETATEEEPSSKRKKTDGRIIDFTERDFEYIKNLFHAPILHYGNSGVMGFVSGYDLMFCPVLIYPIFTAPPDPKQTNIYKRKFILGVGKSSHVITGIKQAFTELYPQYPSDRVYDWKLMKWNKKLYKAVTVNVAEDPAVLFQSTYRSKSFGGAKHIPAVKVTDELCSARKMENAIEVSKYIKEYLSDEVKAGFPPNWSVLSFADVKANLQAALENQQKAESVEEEVKELVDNSDIIKEAFEKIEKQKSQAFCGDSGEEESESDEDGSSGDEE